MKPAKHLITNDRRVLFNEVVKIISAKIYAGEVWLKYMRERTGEILITVLPEDYKLKEVR